MIGDILHFVAGELNRYICLHQGLSLEEEKVVLSSIVEQGGEVASSEQNVILVTMVDLAENAHAYSRVSRPNGMGGVFREIDHLALHLDLRVLFSAYFKGERSKDALNFLTLVIQFFQSKPVFTKANSPDIPEKLERLELIMETIDLQTQSHMWGILGAKYMPSVVYTLKMVSFYDDVEVDPVAPILTVESKSEPIL